MVKAAPKKAPKKSAKSALDAITQSLGGAAEPLDEKSVIEREAAANDVPEPRRKLVQKWCSEIRADRFYFQKVYKRMREDMEFARLGGPKVWVEGDKYTVPIINRFINQSVSSLYAKNPKAVAKKKPKLMYKVWDGTAQQAQAALALVTMGQDSDGQAAAILQEVQQGKAYDLMMKRMGRTLEILFQYFTGEDFPDFKTQLKAMVRRAKTTGVGYVEPAFHRATNEGDPDITQRIGDMMAKLQEIRTRQADLKDEIIQKGDVEVEALEQELKTLEEEKFKVLAEGLMFNFPRSTDIIPDRKCTQLKNFIGADYITQEYLMTAELIKDTYKKDIGTNYKEYVGKNSRSADDDAAGGSQEGDRGDNTGNDADLPSNSNTKKQTKGKACVWRVLNKKSRETFVVCDGYPDYLREPEPLESQLPGWWPIFSLIFNEVEDEQEIFPPSDVHFLKHPQREYNNAREGLREHRRANRPKWFVKKGALEDEEKDDLENAPAFSVIELKGIENDMTIDKLIQQWKGVAIDPNLYETSSIMKDVLFGVGAQSADMGQTGDATATESSIAESSRASTLASNVDDLDSLLSELANACSHIMLQQMTKDTVIEIVGPGAVWPELSGEQIAKELYLDIKAGSSGRPNQAAELANLERSMQYLLQLGGINGTVIASKYATLLDFDEEELIVEGMPSITALNAMAAQKAATQGQIQAGQAEAGNQVAVSHATGATAANRAAAAPPPPGAAAPGQPNNPNQQANGMAGGQNMTHPGQPTGPMAAHTQPIHRYNSQGARVV